MRIACVYFPHFYVQVEGLWRAFAEGRPVVICEGPDGGGHVVDCSEEAAQAGVLPGMSVRDASYRCPDALFLPDSGRCEPVWADILFALGAFSLRIEPEGCGLAYLDITKTLRVYGSEKAAAAAICRDMLAFARLKARTGVGNSRFIAKQAALCAWDSLVIGPGGEMEFLALLPADALPLDDKEKEHLRLLGLSTLKKVAGLSRKALTAQFGPKGSALFETAHGMDDKRPIMRMRNPICLEREFTCDAPLETSGQARTVMEGLLADLAGELCRMRMACRKIEVSLRLQGGGVLKKALVMKKPTGRAKDILARLSDFLETLTLDGPVVSLRLSIPDPVFSDGDQESLFRKKSALLERLQGVRSYFNARYGHTPLLKVEEGDGSSRLPERRFRFVDA
jgi:DNA polymerase-4